MFKSLLRKVSALIVSGCIFISLFSVSAYAYELPHSFWALNDRYGSATSSNDYSETARLGAQIIDLISKEPSNDQTDNIMGSRAYDTAFANYFIGNYSDAVKYFKIYIPYGEKLGWTDGVRIAKEFVKQLTADLSVYKHTSTNQKFYGVKNEPNGVLSGQISEKTQDNDSMVLLYLEYGHFDEFNWGNVVMDNARKSGKAVELALNFPNEGSDAAQIAIYDSYLNSLSGFIGKYTDVPVFLRIAAEMNIWGNHCNPDVYKNAFRIVADRLCGFSNVAIVWSIAHTDPWVNADRPYTADDFYPGDDIVDYVGVTVYCNRYFNGRIWDGIEQFNEICFKSGYSSDPVLMIKDVVEKYGDRKPVIISECGSAYFTGGSINQNHQDWAANRLNEIYSYIPMVYPQVKLISYFNKKIDWEYNYYDLDSSWILNQEYQKMNNSPWIIKGNSRNSAKVFFEKVYDSISSDGMITVSAYPHLYGADSIKVNYYLDDNFVTSSEQAPFTKEISTLGASKLTVIAESNNGQSITKEYVINNQISPESELESLNDIQREYLSEIKKAGIMTGYEDGTIRPFNTITRSEFAVMVCRSMGYEVSGKCTFDDAADHWASAYIRACAEKEAINGVGDNKFAPEEEVTVEQALKIITILHNMVSADAEFPTGFVNAAKENGLTQNLTTQNMQEPLKRIDAAVIMASVE